MNSKPGYALSAFDDASRELERLRQQATVFAEEEERCLSAFGVASTGTLLDLGCGPGWVAARIAASRPHVRVVGVDLDKSLAHFARRNLRHVAIGNGAQLPFGDESFDTIHARFVLRHVPDPSAVLREVKRALRPDGVAVIFDGDDQSLIMDPPAPAFRELFDSKMRARQKAGVDPLIGRRLGQLLGEAGMNDISVRVFSLHTGMCEPGLYAEIIRAWIRARPDVESAVSLEEAEHSLEQWARGEHSFAAMNVVAVSARRAKK